MQPRPPACPSDVPALRLSPEGGVVDEKSEGLSAVELADYPLVCRSRFLALSSKAQTASLGAKRHFIYPQVDVILDDFLTWLAVYGG